MKTKLVNRVKFVLLGLALAGAFHACQKDDAVKVDTISLDKTTLTLALGATSKLNAAIMPVNAGDKSVVWSSSNNAVAVVASDGTVAGVSIGTATITVTSNDGAKSAQCSITVVEGGTPVESVSLDKTSMNVVVGETAQLTATVLPNDAAIKTVNWTSDNNAVAVVSGTGLVAGVSIGSAIITVTTDDGNKTASCEVNVVTGGNVVILQGEYAYNRTLNADSVYLIKGFTYVTDGGKLTIPAGTILKGDKATMGSLIIERGGMIDAQGTANNPIIFTSNQPKGARTYGDWGGVILCGKAHINQTGGDAQIEGGPRTHYGGTDDADNSGILQYIRIEFAGYPFQPDKEINGLTLGGVGSGTTIDHIQVSYSADDSYEWFGGVVNCKYLIAFRGLDDEFDTDNGFSGKVQFAIGLRDYRKADVSGSNGFESDNDATGSGNSPFTSPVFSNVTLIGPIDTINKTNYSGDFKRGMHIRRNSRLSLFNGVVAGWPTGLYLDGSTTWTNAQNGDLQIKNTALVGMLANYGVPSGSSFTTTDVQNWFTDASRENTIISGAKVAGIFGSFLTTNEALAPVLLPTANSPLLTGASFIDAKLADDFFTVTDFIGAFGSENWTEGWANWNPQQTDY
jgi:hypothetical protein